MSMISAAPTQPLPIGTLVLIGLGLVPYAMMLAGISDLHAVDGISRGLAGVYAIIGTALLWILLAALLILAAAKGVMPRWAGIAALALHPASLAASIAAIILLSSIGYGWAVIVPVLSPPLIAAYALWARLPGLHALLPPGRTGGAIWGAVLILSLAPWVGVAQREAEREAHVKAIPFVSEEQQRAQRQQARTAHFEELTPASPLEDYLQYLRRGDELRDRALAAARLVENRQAQAEALLRRGFGLDIVRNLPVLDLQATPSFCEAANDYLVKRATDIRPRGTDPNFWPVENDLEIVLSAFEWLVAQHCDINQALAETEAAIRAYPAAAYSQNPYLAARREAYLDALARLRQAPPR